MAIFITYRRDLHGAGKANFGTLTLFIKKTLINPFKKKLTNLIF